MKCSHCGSLVLDTAERCGRCGAQMTRRSPHRWPEPEPFSLTAEDEPVETADRSEADVNLGFALDREIDRVYGVDEEKEARARGVPWGGFLRRSFAFSIDLFIIFLFSAILFYMSYIGYRVGMAAHHRAVSFTTLKGFYPLVGFTWFCLTGSYFVLFHGMEGQTVGKWLLGLRVVDVRRQPITYRRAFVRWLGAMSFAPLVVGFLWILWSREKRGWHDYLAGTWVIRG